MKMIMNMRDLRGDNHNYNSNGSNHNNDNNNRNEWYCHKNYHLTLFMAIVQTMDGLVSTVSHVYRCDVITYASSQVQAIFI